MGRLLIRWFTSAFITGVALIIVAQLFNSFHIKHFGAAFFAGLIIAVFNLTIRPLLILFTLPVTIMTLGLFLFVINAFILILTQSVMGDLFIIDGFGVALLAAIIIAIINAILTKIIDAK